MKSILTILLAIASCSVAVGQKKDNIYADAGINKLGIAATYDRKLTRHFDIGLGINTRFFPDRDYPTSRSTCYLDLRPNWAIGKSLLFVFVDMGGTYNAGRMPDSFTVSHVNLYTALGAGYHYRINKRGMGPYVSVGWYGYNENLHTTREIYPVGDRDFGVREFFGILSLGFKF